MIRDLVKSYREADGATLYCSSGVNHGRNGGLAFLVLGAINAVSRNLERRGGTLVGRGILDFPGFAVRNGFMVGGARSRIGSFDEVLESLPGRILADEILTPGEGQVRALFVAAGNPALTLPDSSKVRTALPPLCVAGLLRQVREHPGQGGVPVHEAGTAPGVLTPERIQTHDIQVIHGSEHPHEVPYTRPRRPRLPPRIWHNRVAGA
jgi:hypothetical protein